MFFFKKKYETMDINEIDKIDRPKIIDVRSRAEFQGGSLKFSKNIELNKLLANPSQYLEKDVKYYINCASGARSRVACSQLGKQGYQVVNLAGGIYKYKGR